MYAKASSRPFAISVFCCLSQRNTLQYNILSIADFTELIRQILFANAILSVHWSIFQVYSTICPPPLQKPKTDESQASDVDMFITHDTCKALQSDQLKYSSIFSRLHRDTHNALIYHFWIRTVLWLGHDILYGTDNMLCATRISSGISEFYLRDLFFRPKNTLAQPKYAI